jgi:hypothetical protein
MQTPVHPKRPHYIMVALAWLSTLALALFVAFAAPGCRTLSPDGPYAGDEILYSADETIVASYDLLHTFVKWEYENRAALASKPEIKRAADHVRANAQQWIASAIALREAYALSPTAESRRSLKGALAVLRAALTEAVKYMAASQAPPGAPSSAAVSAATPTLHATAR